MIRKLYNSPTSVNWDYLNSQIKNQYPNLITINDVDGQIAVYFEEDITESEDQAISSIVSSHDSSMAPYPPLDPTGALATLLVVLNLVPLQDASNAIGEEPDHLIAEATAWSVVQG